MEFTALKKRGFLFLAPNFGKQDFFQFFSELHITLTVSELILLVEIFIQFKLALCRTYRVRVRDERVMI